MGAMRQKIGRRERKKERKKERKPQGRNINKKGERV